MRNLRDWKIGDSIRNNDHHQQAVEALRELQNRLNRTLGSKSTNRTEFIGKIIDHGRNLADDADIADFTGCRYWLEIQFIQGENVDAAITLAIDTSMKVPASDADTGPFPPNIVPATNLDEYNADTHLLAVDGTVYVLGVAFWDGGDPNQLHFVFSRSLSTSVVVRMDSNATGGGKYIGVLLEAASTADATADLAMPEGMTAGDAALILHLPEDGKPTHWIELGTTSTGVVIGRTDEATPKWIVAIPNGTYRTASPKTLAEGTDTTPEPSTWNRDVATAGTNYGDSPLSVDIPTRVFWDGDGLQLLYFYRTFLYDAGGHLVSITAEQSAAVDTTTDCGGG